MTAEYVMMINCYLFDNVSQIDVLLVIATA